MTALQTKIRLPESPRALLRHGDKVLCLGSCFSENIGGYLSSMGHHIEINPFGTIYNPITMGQALERLVEGRPYDSTELFEFDGLWHSSMHHGSYSAASAESCLNKINADLKRAALLLTEAKYLLLSWGTAWVYKDLEHGGAVVSNCHKRPEKAFDRRLYSVEELTKSVQPILARLLELRPDLQIITTVSPIRHLRDGAHGNQLSKSTLLLMDESLRQDLGERYLYFPSYEILLDELRDYRFYADDMAHPSELAQRIIREYTGSWLLSDDAKLLGREVLRLKAQYEHRPLQEDHPEAELRREQLLLLIRSMQSLHPEVRIDSWFRD